MSYYYGYRRRNNGYNGYAKGICPKCGGTLSLRQNRSTDGWFCACTKCNYTGPPSRY